MNALLVVLAADPAQDGLGDLLDKIATYGGLIVGIVLAQIAIFLGIAYLTRARNQA